MDRAEKVVVVEHLSKLSDLAHHVGCRHDGVEVHPALLDLLDHFGATDVIGSGVLGFLLLFATRDGEHWILKGSKNFITNGAEADVCIVFAMGDRSKGVKGITSHIDIKSGA